MNKNNPLVHLLLYRFAIRTENLELLYELDFGNNKDYKSLYELELAKWSFWSDSGTAAFCVFCGEKIKVVKDKTVVHQTVHLERCPFYLLQQIDFTI